MNKNNFWKNLINVILIFILFRYSWIFQLIPVVIFDLNVDSISGATKVLLNAFASLSLAIILFFIFKNSLFEDFKKFKNNFVKCFDIGFKYWFIGLVCMIGFNFIIMNILNLGQAGNEESVQNMISSLPYIMLISAGLFAPFSEEIIFRKSIRSLFNNKYIYIIISGLIFGIAHVIGNISSWGDCLYILSYGSLGVGFAKSYYETDTIFTPMLFHMIHNVALVILSII